MRSSVFRIVVRSESLILNKVNFISLLSLVIGIVFPLSPVKLRLSGDNHRRVLRQAQGNAVDVQGDALKV